MTLWMTARPGDSHGHAAWSREGVWKGAEEGNDLKIEIMSYIYNCHRNEPMMKMHKLAIITQKLQSIKNPV